MRTVSFSSDPVQEALKTKVVPAFVNTTGTPATGASCKHAPNEAAGMCTPGIGHQNVQCLFLTPEGEIFHAVSGHQGPKAMAEELDYASRLFAQMKEDPEQARDLVVNRHRATLTALGEPENGGLDMMGMLDGSFRRRKDAQFCVDHPLMGWEALERRPQLLVGNDKTFFASKASGSSNGDGARPRR
jgi:hypothetical protein